MRNLIIFLYFFFITSISQATLVTTAYVTPDDVTITHLETDRVNITDAVNNLDGVLIETGSVAATKLDDDANPHNRWNEAFNDFVYTGLTIPTSASLTSTTVAGTAYINGWRVVKDATAKTYTASKHTYVDLSDSGVYTYQAVTIGAAEPAVSLNSIRLGRVSTDSTTVLSVRDDRVTGIQLSVGGVTLLSDVDEDTKVNVENSTDEDIIRFSLGNTTLTTAQEVLTLQAVNATSAKLEPTTNNFVDLGTSSKKFRSFHATAITSDTSDINGGTMDSVQIGGTTATGEIIVNDSNDDADGLGSQGTSGQVLTSAGAGANPTWTAGGKLKFTSTTTWSGTTTSGNIAIEEDKNYIAVIEITTTVGGTATVTMLVNAETSSEYSYANRKWTFANPPVNSLVGSAAGASFPLIAVGQNQAFVGEYFLSTTNIFRTKSFYITGSGIVSVGGVDSIHDFSGFKLDNTAATSSFVINSDINTNGNVYLYEISKS